MHDDPPAAYSPALGRTSDSAAWSRPAGRYAAPTGPPGPRRLPGLDLASVLVAGLGLVLCLRGRAYAAYAPLLGLILPAGRLILSASYRWRVTGAAARVWAQTRAFGRGQGPIPWAAAAAFVAVPFFLLDLVHGDVLGTHDTLPVIPTAASLVREGNWDLSEFAHTRPRSLLHMPDGRLKYCFRVVRGRLVSALPVGMAPFGVAVVGPAYLCGADLDRLEIYAHLEKVTAALAAALTLGLFFLTAARLGSPAAAAVVTFFLATASALLTTAGLGAWQHGGVTTWLLLVLLIEFASRGAPGGREILIQGLALGQMLGCRPTAALLVGLFGLWVLVRSPRRALLLGALALAAFAPWVAYYARIYGHPLAPLVLYAHINPQPLVFFRVATMLGVLICPSRGLFVYQPWAVPAAATAVTRTRTGSRTTVEAGPPGWMTFAAVASAAHAFIISAWYDWVGGYCWGSRLLTDVLPLLGLLTVPSVALLLGSRGGRALLLGLALTGPLMHAPCLLRHADRWNFTVAGPRDPQHWSWVHPPFLYHPSPGAVSRKGAGKVTFSRNDAAG